jgi:threonine dehydrogenase-like Zn-dependent dehydrogenase
VKALCWEGVNEVSVEQVPDPEIINKQDAIVKVRLSSVCGSDLHQISGEIAEVGEEGQPARRREPGGRLLGRGLRAMLVLRAGALLVL